VASIQKEKKMFVSRLNSRALMPMAVFAVAAASAYLFGQQDFSKVEIETISVAPVSTC
jgi:hypothetical protein